MIPDILFGAIGGMILLAIIDEIAWALHKRRIRRETWRRIEKQLEKLDA